MKKLFLPIILLCLIAITAFATALDMTAINESKEYMDLISIRPIASDYKDAYNSLWLEVDFYNLSFKHRDELGSTNWNTWVNNKKENKEYKAWISKCYPADNSDIISELGDKTNEYFNNLISGIRIISEGESYNLDTSFCRVLDSNPTKKATIKIIRLQHIKRYLHEYVFGGYSLDPSVGVLTSHRDEIGKNGLEVYSGLKNKLEILINEQVPTINAEIDRIWSEALHDKKYAKQRGDGGKWRNAEMIRISKNWFLGTSARLPKAVIENLPNQDERILRDFKNLNIEKTPMYKLSLQDVVEWKPWGGGALKIDPKNVFLNEDYILLYLPDEQIKENIDAKWPVDIWVPQLNNTAVRKVFSIYGVEIEDFRIRGEILELGRSRANAGTPIFLGNGEYKGCLIGFSIEWSYKNSGGRMVQLFTQDNVKFIEDTISTVTPDKWEEIKHKIIYE